jgi:cyclopropane-fatty-acyl-phospholipid synthase
MKLAETGLQQFSMRVPRSGRFMLRLLARLQYGRLDLVIPGGQTFSFTGERPGPDAVLEIRDWGVFDAVIRSGDVGFAETYLDDRWQTPDLYSLLLLAASNRRVLELALYGKWWGGLIYRLRHLLRANTREGARRNIHAHYDLGNDFYRAWLDPTMTYSAALFEGDADRSLEQAQIAKYERILRRLDVRRGASILELGCGWGGFAEYAVRTRGCRVHGITLSNEQLLFARQRVEGTDLARSMEFSLTDYRDVGGSFDHVVSIEMFEAVGERYWTGYFESIRERLKPHGSALVQTITIADELFARYRLSTDFIQQYIFPGGMLPGPAVFRKLARKARLQVTNEHAFGQDYAETLRRWRNGYATVRHDLRSSGFDERFERLWNFYLAYCEAGFRLATTDVFQFELRRA